MRSDVRHDPWQGTASMPGLLARRGYCIGKAGEEKRALLFSHAAKYDTANATTWPASDRPYFELRQFDSAARPTPRGLAEEENRSSL